MVIRALIPELFWHPGHSAAVFSSSLVEDMAAPAFPETPALDELPPKQDAELQGSLYGSFPTECFSNVALRMSKFILIRWVLDNALDVCPLSALENKETRARLLNDADSIGPLRGSRVVVKRWEEPEEAIIIDAGLKEIMRKRRQWLTSEAASESQAHPQNVSDVKCWEQSFALELGVDGLPKSIRRTAPTHTLCPFRSVENWWNRSSGLRTGLLVQLTALQVVLDIAQHESGESLWLHDTRREVLAERQLTRRLQEALLDKIVNRRPLDGCREPHWLLEPSTRNAKNGEIGQTTNKLRHNKHQYRKPWHRQSCHNQSWLYKPQHHHFWNRQFWHHPKSKYKSKCQPHCQPKKSL
ncbi:hypothetical protein HPB47_002623 [Ixodes persulcatus]|uniref:Uncharacterized protein n=1 Tax=Ixodes persulcatus TaxID=34615 RepID=A0AC60PKP9_IXOPE|nr:hypothetical protein HPB47_002623 [Ixodes persulcatus]